MMRRAAATSSSSGAWGLQGMLRQVAGAGCGAAAGAAWGRAGAGREERRAFGRKPNHDVPPLKNHRDWPRQDPPPGCFLTAPPFEPRPPPLLHPRESIEHPSPLIRKRRAARHSTRHHRSLACATREVGVCVCVCARALLLAPFLWSMHAWPSAATLLRGSPPCSPPCPCPLSPSSISPSSHLSFPLRPRPRQHH